MYCFRNILLDDLVNALSMQDKMDANIALLPFKPMLMKVLQCSFISGIKYGLLLSLCPSVFSVILLKWRDFFSFTQSVSCIMYIS